jgi:hypothetical protein
LKKVQRKLGVSFYLIKKGKGKTMTQRRAGISFKNMTRVKIFAKI